MNNKIPHLDTYGGFAEKANSYVRSIADFLESNFTAQQAAEFMREKGFHSRRYDDVMCVFRRGVAAKDFRKVQESSGEFMQYIHEHLLEIEEFAEINRSLS